MSTRNLHEKKVSVGWAIGLSGLLTLIKSIASFITGSTALLASALDSLMDICVSGINYFSIKRAAQPPDEDHAYGHEKIESLTSYTQGVLFALLSLWILGKSIHHLVIKASIQHVETAFIVIILSVIINTIITTILSRSEKKTESLILKAEKSHYLMDILSYIIIFVSIFLVKLTGWSGWDGLGGIFLAGYIAFLAGHILLQAGNELVDRSLPQGALDELDLLIKNHHSHIKGYHELRTRKAGHKRFIDFHLVFKSDQNLEEAHEIAESLIEKIKAKFEYADVTIHEDPEHEIE